MLRLTRLDIISILFSINKIKDDFHFENAFLTRTVGLKPTVLFCETLKDLKMQYDFLTVFKNMSIKILQE